MSTGQPYILLSGPTYCWLYFATITSTAFFSLTCMQTFVYYVHCHKDPLHFKILVAILSLLNTIHEGLIVAGTYKYIAASLENPLASLNYPPELNLMALPGALVAVLAQGFLMYRIYIFSGKKTFTLLLWFILATSQLVSATIYVARALYIANGSLQDVDITALHDSRFESMFALTLVSGAVQDVLIVIFMVFLLLRERTNTLFSSTAQMVQRLIVFAVNTGMWTAIFALLVLIFLYVLPSKGLYTLFIFPICSLYCNTVLANLNVRSYLRDGADVQHNGVNLLATATPFPDGQTKLVFSNPEMVRTRTAELVTSSDADVSTVLEENQA